MIDVAPLPLPTWADPDQQLDTLLRDLGFSAGHRDDEVKAAFDGALAQLGSATGTLGRQLVPAVVRTLLPANRTSCYLRLPPVIEVIGFERQDGSDAWIEATDVVGTVEEDQLRWKRGYGLRVVAHHGYLDGQEPANLKVALRLMVRQTIDGHDDARQRAIGNLLAGLKVYAA